MSNAEMDAPTRAADGFARSVAGDDDVLYAQVFSSALNIAARAVQGSPAGRAAAISRTLTQVSAAEPAPGGGMRTRQRVALGKDARDFHQDPIYAENVKRLVQAQLVARVRIVGGTPTEDFTDCVAVGAPDKWCCSGTLVANNVVLTAGHCATGGCADRVSIGPRVDHGARVVGVADRTIHPDYRESKGQLFNDLTVLILEDEIADVAPRPIADPQALEENFSERNFSVRLVGYGFTDTDGSAGYGIRRLVDVPLASPDPAYGARPETEFVAGKPLLDRDSCNGDSGGPAYVENEDGQWALMGATSRPTKNSKRVCGDGGIYTTVAAYLDWIRSVPGGNWA